MKLYELYLYCKWRLIGVRAFKNTLAKIETTRPQPLDNFEIFANNVKLVYQNHPKIVKEMMEMIDNARDRHKARRGKDIQDS